MKIKSKQNGFNSIKIICRIIFIHVYFSPHSLILIQLIQCKHKMSRQFKLINSLNGFNFKLYLNNQLYAQLMWTRCHVWEYWIPFVFNDCEYHQLMLTQNAFIEVFFFVENTHHSVCAVFDATHVIYAHCSL